ncbi:MAG TPA: hypothetical protein PKI19_02860 [Elusimicrobiales bacterium]|nr:hypothetical protein [Elusimicrobiales bacterium]
MKRCPKCNYDNADQAEKCGICQCSLSGVAPAAMPVPEKKSGQAWALLLSGALLLACGFFFFRAPPAVPAAPPQPSAEDAFTYEGVLYPLEKMKQLRFLPLADKRSAAELMSSPEEKVGFAAAELAGIWARESALPAERREFFESLLKAAGESRGAARRQAAVELGLSAVYGFPFAPYAREMRKIASGLIKEKEEALSGAGFFLASMAGFSDFAPELRKIFAAAPSPYLKLSAACALSRLGDPAADKYLFSAAASDAEWGREAISCLSYSVSPEAGTFLEKAAAGKLAPQAADPAKIALTLRKQLAIINH